LSAEQRRQQIIGVAQRMYVVAGRDSVSMQKIANKAGVNIALVYQHFRSSVELYEAAVIQPLEGHLHAAMTASRADWPAEPEQRCVCMHEALLNLVEQVGPLIGIALFSDGTTGHQFYRNQIVPLIDGWIVPMINEIGRAAGIEIDARTVAAQTFGIHLSFLSPKGVGHGDRSTLAQRLADFQWSGLVRPPAAR
jgi:AcrR family transcriptional regulator